MKIFSRGTLLACLVAAGVEGAGCGQNRPKEKLAAGTHHYDLAQATNEINLGTNDVIFEAAGAQVDLSGRRLAEKVQAALETDPGLIGVGDRVTVEAHSGRIILRGQAASDQQKATILSRAAAVAGRENIEDQIQLPAQDPGSSRL